MLCNAASLQYYISREIKAQIVGKLYDKTSIYWNEKEKKNTLATQTVFNIVVTELRMFQQVVLKAMPLYESGQYVGINCWMIAKNIKHHNIKIWKLMAP